MASAYEITATALKAVIDGEFSTEGYTAVHDRLHESLGWKRTEIGISPESQAPMSGNASVMDTIVLIQFYDRWDKEVDPEQQVNPFRITGYADRLARAIETQQAGFAGSTEVWYFEPLSIAYPNDPTGNKTRFHMIVRAKGDNVALIQR
jgi:hypothetical protein